ncbi:MAG: FixH family protein [Thiotrichales bacterium]|jgi:nitrogen fixation protein FixH|nr:FixH family protein [Thiotrichales bacterium]MBT3854674.1 FixH family protein [Thiotrichales bacterium]MBT4653111.1 FixH family protein [Thiotrichales bacterium]MBT5499209.1 FixH family protein [Thiotrichales bacterium]MBT5983622.1 FixH family protein [Thiotrichales bacterium]
MHNKASLRDRIIPLYFVAFFVVIAIFDGIFVYLATSTHSGVVTENAYQKGLNYNQYIDAYNLQEIEGWIGHIEFTGSSLIFQLNDKQGKPIETAEVVANISRSTKSGLDFVVLLVHMTNGRYENKAIKFPLKGQWDIRVLAQINQKKYQRSKRIIVY